MRFRTAAGRRRALAAVLLAVAPWVVAAGAASPAAAQERAADRLLADYAPVIVVRDQQQTCGPGEPYRPVPVDVVLDRSDVVLRGGDGSVITTAPGAKDLAAADEASYLDLPGDPLDPGCEYEEWFDRVGAAAPTAVYGRVATDPAHPGTTVVQYWFWWVFNDWNDLHEGDWEMIQVVFDAAGPAAALRSGPTSVAFAQHEGAQVVDWADVQRDSTHVAVYPGQGSHAAYVTQARWFGTSASAGFGCDDTSVGEGVGAELLRPRVVPLQPDTPPAWLEFPGRWGQREAAFNNGPTGPAAKQQWDEPVGWMLDKGRPDAVALPWAPSEAQEAFCTLSAAGSTLFVRIMDHPVRVSAVLLGTAAVVVLIARSTRWRGSPRRAAARRRAGQLLVAPWAFLARTPRPLLGLAAGLTVLLAGSALLQRVAARPEPAAELTRVGQLQVLWPGVAIAIAAAVMAAAGVAVVVAGAAGVVAGRGVAAGARAWWVCLATYLVVAATASTLILLPVALILGARWAAAPGAAVAECGGVRASWRRSSQMSAGRRWRALGVLVLLALLVVVPGPLVGALLLLTPLPVPVVTVITAALTSLAVVLAGVALMLLFFDLRARADEPAAATPALDQSGPIA